MANCVRCGREISHGNLCPDCDAATRAVQAPTSGGTIEVQRPASPRFSVTTILVALNVAVYIAMVASGVSLLEPTTQQLIRWGANYGPLSLGPQPWRMLTSNYVHIGLLHILLNMWCLWSLGKLAERIFPPWTYVLLYTACGLGGSLASLWWHPNVIGAGASGAIFGLAGALISVFYLGKLPISPQAVKSTLRSLVTFAAYNLFFGLTAGIDNFAHLGGLITGLIFGAMVARHIVAPPEERQRWQLYASVTLGILLAVGTVGVRRSHAQVRPLAIAKAEPAPQSEPLEGIVADLQKGNYDQAIVQLKSYLQQNPESPVAHYLLGMAYMGKHQPDDAIPEYQQALRLAPNYVEAEIGLGMAYTAKGMQPEAEQAYRKAAQIQQRAQNR
jgi:rhomboid protease GluP